MRLHCPFMYAPGQESLSLSTQNQGPLRRKVVADKAGLMYGSQALRPLGGSAEFQHTTPSGATNGQPSSDGVGPQGRYMSSVRRPSATDMKSCAFLFRPEAPLWQFYPQKSCYSAEVMLPISCLDQTRSKRGLCCRAISVTYVVRRRQ